MRRLIVGSFITTYLGLLGFGLTCQMSKAGVSMHPAMYYIVWDMYCAWGAYDRNFRAVAEGVSGTYYDLNPPPWGAFRPFNTLDRFQSISAPANQARFIRHVVGKTKHEPIARMFVVEECWPKQYDLPESIWNKYNAIPYQPFRYTKVILEQSGDGDITGAYPSWIDGLGHVALSGNPRLDQEIRQSRSFWQVENTQQYFTSGETNSYSVMRSPATN